MLDRSASAMAQMIRRGEISSYELVSAHLDHIARINPKLNAVVHWMADRALQEAAAADRKLQQKGDCGPLQGVPFSIKDSIDVRETPCTAGTLGRKHAPCAHEDATVVARLRAAGGIPIVKTNLPELLFAFETDNLIFGRTNNPYDLSRTCGGSSGGEAALIAACGSPMGLGSDCFGSVRVPAAFCGIASIKPTSGRLPRTGHVPPAGGWIEQFWQIGPMARRAEDLALALSVMAGADGRDWTAPPVLLDESREMHALRVAFFTYNGVVRCSAEVEAVVRSTARVLEYAGMRVEEAVPPCINQAYELELAIIGADGVEGIDAYLNEIGSASVHPLLKNFTDRMRPFRATAGELASRWARWDEFRAAILRFFDSYDVVLCPVYTQPALLHGESMKDDNFAGFGYTMAWNVAGFPAATVRAGNAGRLPLNVQVAARPWHDRTAIEVCRVIERELGGWQPAPLIG
ncbi:MAG: amidase [Acidobacteriaceae bacterium]|nr:amidase [Acidobacteriaceae bacterium]